MQTYFSMIYLNTNDYVNILLYKNLIMLLLYKILLLTAGLYAHFYSLHNYIYLSVIYFSIFHIFFCHWKKDISFGAIILEGDFFYLIAYIYWLYYFSKQELIYMVPLLLGCCGRLMEILHQNE
jgi:hypothetical protein